MSHGEPTSWRPSSVARTHSEGRRARRNKWRDWVRKGGLVPAAVLAWFVVIGLLLWLAFAVANRLSGSDEVGWWHMAALTAGAVLIAASGYGLFRLVSPKVIGPASYASITAWAENQGLDLAAVPKGEPFNRRVVAGQLGDGHRTAAYFAHAHHPGVSVAVHGVTKNPSDEAAWKDPAKLRLAEIVYVVWTAPLGQAIARTVVATPSDDPASPLEPLDRTARRFESGHFNGAYRVLSDDPRAAHYLFDPAMLDALLALQSRRVRLLWEGDLAYVACELREVDADVLAAVPWLLERMQRNSSLIA